MFVAAKIAYDGSKFYGFAKQQEYLSVVGFLEDAVQKLGIKTQVIGAGRTDKGVHATGQIVKFEIPNFWNLDKLLYLLNLKTYPMVLFKRIWEVAENFHPRFDAKRREYRYIFGRTRKNIYLHSYISCEQYGDKEKIKEAMRMFIGKHDFAFFSKSGSDVKTSIREIYKICLYEHRIFQEKYLVACFQANGFLYAQIRMMMGAILAFSRGELSLEDISLQLLAKKRAYWIPSSPNGLYLTKIFY